MHKERYQNTPFGGVVAAFALAVLFLVGPVTPSFATIGSCVLPGCPTGCPPEGGAANLTRTFSPFAKTTSGSGFEVTREDFLRLYAIGREVHIHLSPTEGSYEMDIGLPDIDNAQTWVMPDIPFEGPSVWAITDPTDTPHASVFPEATHVLVSMNDQVREGTVYMYYNIAETALIFVGEAIEPLQGAPLETYQYNIPLMLFPMNDTVGIFTEAEIDYEGIPALRLQDIEMHGFGTFASNLQETVNAGTFIDDVVFSNPGADDPYDPDEIITFETYYTIFGEDGSWFGFFVDDPPEGDSTAIVGDVYAHFVKYWQVVDPTATAIDSETPPEVTSWAVYPNPATDVVRFSEPTTISLYDILGRAVRTGTEVQEINVSDLSPGLYLVRADTGQSKTLVIQ